MDSNIILQTDSYKVSHWLQYPPGTTNVYSYFESRGGRFPAVTFFGLQYIIKRWLEGRVVTEEKIDEAEEFFNAHFGANIFNRAGWEIIADEYDGRLPIEIRAVDEGSTIPVGNVLMTVENTDSRLPWLTNYVETLLSQVWYPSTVATQSREMRKIILRALETTGDPLLIDFKLHDFGYRGSTSVESAGIGGAAHLVNFKGTDTLEGILTAHKYYGAGMCGFSIPAAEHSTITSWGRGHEADAYRNMLEKFPSGLVAVVSDSYDIFNACANIWGGELKDAVEARNGVLVIRPDSGNPPEVISTVLSILRGRFGATTNHKGFLVLNPKVRIIQGDGVDIGTVKDILGRMVMEGWSADNIAFGSGGALLQKMDRDTQRFAFKCSAIKVNGEWRDVFKSPITDPGKNSKAGRLRLVRTNGEYRTEREESGPNETELRRVFWAGRLHSQARFDEIRERARL